MLVAAAANGKLVFDQLILEQSLVHIARRLHDDYTTPRMQILTRLAEGSYVTGIRSE
jgi:hypothetical protein